jgi:hypothetical protein
LNELIPVLQWVITMESEACCCGGHVVTKQRDVW